MLKCRNVLPLLHPCCRCTTSKMFHGTSFWWEVLRFVLILGVVGFVSFGWGMATVLVCPAQIEQGPNSEAAQTQSCIAMRAVGNFINFVSLACALYWAWFVGGPRRTQLRQQLGIPDSGAGGDCCTCCGSPADKGARSDRCLHFWCLCCALAQEKRTVRYLQMAGKLPPPPPEGYEPLITHQAPDVNVGMNRAAGVAKGEGLV